ncbi:transcription antitermination factor NusB [Capnocytophaga bilenii]
MITRRHIRAKVMQSVYALQQSQSQDLDKELKFLEESAANLYDLYLLQFSLLTEIHKYATHQHNIAQKKYLTTNNNTHLAIVNNQLLCAISQNNALQDAIENAHINLFDVHYEYVKNLYKDICFSSIYEQYSTQKNDFNTDKDFVIAIFEEIIVPNDELYDFIDDYNITWTDDYPVVNSYIVKLLTNLRPNPPQKYFTPSLYNSDEEKKYLTDLLKKTVLNDDKLKKLVESKLTNWDKERVATLDLILIKMAVSEFLYFPSIPVKVTINEYLELAKDYSTSKSNFFINGILTTVHKQLTESDEIKKIGRGLL